MKSEHRHELKTNELADWIAHLPQWSKDNSRNITIGLTVVAVLIVVFVWRGISQNAYAQDSLRLSHLVSQVDISKSNVMRSSMEGNDTAGTLKQPAAELGDFAKSASDPILAATAYLQQARTLRAELHLTTESYGAAAIAAQIKQAQASYTKALDLAKQPTIRAAARYGLGLCAEELGEYDEATKIYTKISTDTTLDGTAGQTAASERLKILPNYTKNLSFRSMPQPEVKVPEINTAAPVLNLEAAPPTPAGPTAPPISDSNTEN